MKILILKEKLKSGLNIIERIIGKNLNLPILDNVLIEGSKNFLSLTTTNLEIAIKYWILTKIEKEGKITVPAKFLSSLISLLPNEKLTLETKNKILYIYYKNSESFIKTQDFEEFPIIPKIETEDFIEIDNQSFCQGLSQVVDFSTSTQVRPELSGIYFNFEKNQVKLVATDSFRLSEKKLSFKSLSSEKQYSFILPQRAAREIINVLLEKEGKLKIYPSSNQVLFEFPMPEVSHPQFQLTSRLIEGEYPNYKEIIPEKYETKITLSKNEFLNQIKTAGLFTGKINEVQIKIDPKRKGIEISSKNPDLGESKSFIPGKVEGKKMSASFNFRFLVDGLLNMTPFSRDSKEVIFELNGGEGPAVLKTINDPNYIYIIMPIKSS